MQALDTCPGCGVVLPFLDGPTHRYIGASPACWAIFTALVNAGEPPIAPSPFNALLTDAYAAQHPGTPSDQAIQSVAVHTIVLYAILERGVNPGRALWLRQHLLRPLGGSRHRRFSWMIPPSFAGARSITDVARLSTPDARRNEARGYVADVWRRWAALHQTTIASWYELYGVAS